MNTTLDDKPAQAESRSADSEPASADPVEFVSENQTRQQEQQQTELASLLALEPDDQARAIIKERVGTVPPSPREDDLVHRILSEGRLIRADGKRGHLLTPSGLWAPMDNSTAAQTAVVSVLRDLYEKRISQMVEKCSLALSAFGENAQVHVLLRNLRDFLERRYIGEFRLLRDITASLQTRSDGNDIPESEIDDYYRHRVLPVADGGSLKVDDGQTHYPPEKTAAFHLVDHEWKLPRPDNSVLKEAVTYVTGGKNSIETVVEHFLGHWLDRMAYLLITPPAKHCDSIATARNAGKDALMELMAGAFPGAVYADETGKSATAGGPIHAARGPAVETQDRAYQRKQSLGRPDGQFLSGNGTKVDD